MAGADIELSQSRALCRPCGELFPLEATAPRAARPTDLKAALQFDGERLVLTTTPPRWTAVPVVAFAAVWSGFLVFWYKNALQHPSPSSIALWFPILHVGVGVMLIVRAAALLLDRTQLTLDSRELVVTRGPISRTPTVREGTSGLVRFETGTRTRGMFEGASSFDGRRGDVQIPVVFAITSDQRSIPLPLDLTQPDHARFLAAELNEQLHAAQRPATPDGYRG